MMMERENYKRLHEQQMLNNEGSSRLHTVSCISYIVFSCIIAAFTNEKDYKKKLVLEYFIIVFPLVFGCTIFSNYVNCINMLNFLLMLIIYKHLNRKGLISANLFDCPNTFPYKHLQCISSGRGLTYLITCFAILAVDFKLFPRALAKTEKYGYSLMDTGVGFFILCSGLVHKRFSNLYSVFSENLKLLSILLILGISRYYLVNELDYQQHLTEYGVHWNFFYTLGATKVLSSILLHKMNTFGKLKIGICVAVFHELILSFGSKDWALEEKPRVNFLTANKEGIVSILGYMALYIFGYYMKEILSDTKVKVRDILKRLCTLTVISFFINILSEIINPASRILINIAYISYHLVLFILVMIVLYVLEVFNSTQKTKNIKIYLLEEINKNGLVFFIIGNLLTGIVNLSVQTFMLNNFYSLCIINLYMLIIVILVISLNKIGLKI